MCVFASPHLYVLEADMLGQAFHGSPLRNWHSIIREGLLLKTPLHGRAYGHGGFCVALSQVVADMDGSGVYFAKDGSVSMGTYATRGSCRWKSSAIIPSACVALAEIVNLPEKFVSNNPFFVVADTSWIITRVCPPSFPCSTGPDECVQRSTSS